MPKIHTSNLVGLLFLVGTIAICSASPRPRYVGQDIYAEPDCSIVSDHKRMFRNISDPTHYWMCPEDQTKALYLQCGPNHAFMENLQKCVEWENWKWLEPYTHLE